MVRMADLYLFYCLYGVCSFMAHGVLLFGWIASSGWQKWKRQPKSWLDQVVGDRFVGFNPPADVSWPSVDDLVCGRRLPIDENEARFLNLYASRPQVMDGFSARTRALIDRGVEQGSAMVIFGDIRHELRAAGEAGFANYMAKYYARLWMERHPPYIGWFKIAKSIDGAVLQTEAVRHSVLESTA